MSRFNSKNFSEIAAMFQHLYRYFLLLLILFPGKSTAQSVDTASIDGLIQRAMRAFTVPGLSIAIVSKGHTVFVKGYGVRSTQSNLGVNQKTDFAIASNTKAFTTAALGMLIQQGKLKWDDLVRSHLPEFELNDPWVTAHFTVIDLLTHRSGLPQGAGDLLHFPDSTDFTVKDVLHSLRYLKPTYSFRSRYEYDNICYLVAAELVSRLSGMSWSDFLTNRIFKPLQMTRTSATFDRLADTSNFAMGHGFVEGKLVSFPPPQGDQDAGAGGIYASAEDLATWMICQLASGKFANGRDSLFSSPIHQAMWTAQIDIPVKTDSDYRTHFGAYGLGWFLNDLRGVEEVSHTGQDQGMISAVDLIPEQQLGIAICTNMEGGGAVRAVIDQLMDGYTGGKSIDRVAYWQARVAKSHPVRDTILEKVWQVVSQNQKAGKKVNNEVIGIYKDPWFGNVRIFSRREGIAFQAERSRHLLGTILPYDQSKYVIRWDDRSLNGDAWLLLVPARGRPQHLKLTTISPLAPVAFDFGDLSFDRMP